MVANGFEEAEGMSCVDIDLDGKAEHINVDQVNLQMSTNIFKCYFVNKHISKAWETEIHISKSLDFI